MLPPSSAPPSARGAARRVTPAAWVLALVGLVIGALPGGAFLAAAHGLLTSDGTWPVLAVGTLLYYLSLPLAAWQFGRRVRLGTAWGYVAGVIIATGAMLTLLFSAGGLF